MTITLRAGVLNSGIQQNGNEFLTVDTSNNATLSNNLVVTGTLTATGAITGSSTVAGSTGILYPLTSGTAVATTSGTSIDFTSIPSWVKRITVMLNGVSTNGSSNLLFQIGAGSVTTTGYISSASLATSVAGSTAGFIATQANAAAFTQYGAATISLVNGNIWVYSSITIPNVVNNGSYASGGVTLSGTLDRVRLTTVNGTDTFDAGSVNILYE
jgi:hypothetical protein